MTGVLLLLHSAGLDGPGSRGFVDLPSVIAPDLTPDSLRTSEFDLATIAAQVAEELAEPVHVLGLSMGGMVAQHLALSHPALVRSLVLACTTSRPPYEVLEQRAQFTMTASREEVVRDCLERWFTAEGLAEDGPGVRYARGRLHTVPQELLAAQWSALSRHDLADRLQEIDAPTTCLAGIDDVSTPVDVMTQVRDGIPRARLVTIEGPHMAFLERPGTFNSALADHLRWAERECGA